MVKTWSVAIVVLALAGCGPPRPRQAAPGGPEVSVPNRGPPPSGRVYRVNEQESELRVLVYRAGALAGLGHNHVMINHAVRGSVTLDAAPAFSLNLPVAAFVVDDAQARLEEGADFAAAVPDGAKAGTLRNMRSSAVLDADEFPVITLDSVAVSAAAAGPGTGTMTAAVAISIAGRESRIDVPFLVRIEAGRLSATGTVELRQSALGLTPYSLLLGALQVQDSMTVKFKIVADLAAGTQSRPQAAKRERPRTSGSAFLPAPPARRQAHAAAAQAARRSA